MSQAANVSSIAALMEFKSALLGFNEAADMVLTTVEMEIRRMLEWLQHEQPAYWERQSKARRDELAEAKAALARKRQSTMDGRPPDLSEEKANLRRAQLRMEEAEQKIENCRRWGRLVQQAVTEYQSQSRPMGDMLERDVPHCLELLKRMIDALEAYTAMPVPAVASPAAAAGFGAAAAETSEKTARGEPASGGREPPDSPACQLGGLTPAARHGKADELGGLTPAARHGKSDQEGESS